MTSILNDKVSKQFGHDTVSAGTIEGGSGGGRALVRALTGISGSSAIVFEARSPK